VAMFYFRLLIFSRGLATQDTCEGATCDAPTKLHFVEPFNESWRDRWHVVRSDKFRGRWEVQRRQQESIEGDLGLVLLDEAAHHAAAADFTPIKGADQLVVQYEVLFQKTHECGGAYVKVFDAKKASFSDETPYIIMFGPDKCGDTKKVHFILRVKNPVSAQWQEHHCKDAPAMEADRKTHLYTLRVRKDNSFEILIDGVVQKSGNLLVDMSPPVNPPKIIDDPTDKKPADWVDDAKIADPKVKKPSKEEWDEDAPQFIHDPAEKMPEGWLLNEPSMVEDLDADEPDDWDNDENGMWQAPMIPNPDCSIGCGPWKARQIRNPAYKGKWEPPMIDNPAYKGEWKARQIDNPNFFIDEIPFQNLPQVSAIGFELWTMQNKILFDNVVVDTDETACSAYAEKTFFIRKAIEDAKSQQPVGPSIFNRIYEGVRELVHEHSELLMYVGILLLPFVLIACMVSWMKSWNARMKSWNEGLKDAKMKAGLKGAEEEKEESTQRDDISDSQEMSQET